MATEPKTRYVYEDLASFPDDRLRREIIDGELIVTAAPRTRHQAAVLQVGAALLAYSQRQGGTPYIAPTDVYFANDTVVEPDVLFVDKANTTKVEEMLIRGAPNIVVEVSSPSSIRIDLVRKLELYQRFGVPEYWYVDLEADRVEIAGSSMAGTRLRCPSTAGTPSPPSRCRGSSSPSTPSWVRPKRNRASPPDPHRSAFASAATGGQAKRSRSRHWRPTNPRARPRSAAGSSPR